MAITKAQKDEIVASYVDLLGKTSGFIIIQYTGMRTPDINQLRAKVRDASGTYLAAKNTLLIKALEQRGWVVPADLLQGPSAVIFGMDNLPGVAKAVVEFLTDKDVQKIAAKGGVMDNKVFDAAQVIAISKLPTLDEIRAQVAGLIVAPATGIVSILQAANSQIVNVIQAYLDEHNKEAGDAA
ncbi:MAG: 50S ribosomal protein L10 [Anaerolineae bacterium]|nr:50S ribosomal protein L10 [Anaerolineae bacterium]